MANRITQVADEVLHKPTSEKSRVTQVADEVLHTADSTNVLITQVAVEVLKVIGYQPPRSQVVFSGVEP